MFLPEVKKQIMQIAAGTLILGAAELLVYLLVGQFDLQAVFGATFGCAFTILNFILLALSVQKAVDKTPTGAKAYMSGTYTLRLLLTAAMIIAAVRLPQTDWIAAVIPLLFPRMIIMALNLAGSKKKSKEETAS